MGSAMEPRDFVRPADTRNGLRHLMRVVAGELEKRHGVQRFYSTLEVSKAVAACGFGLGLHTYAHAFFCSGQEFRELYWPDDGDGGTRVFADRTELLLQILAHTPDAARAVTVAPEVLASLMEKVEAVGWNWDWDWSLIDVDLSGMFEFFDW
jgi:hypothetical protein